ncbi:MAG: OmpA family protein [Candidatus Binatia bacterium]
MDRSTRNNRHWGMLAGVGIALLGGCVFQSTYDNMLQQQQSIEAALRAEIASDQVEIEQLKNGIRVRMSSDLLFSEGGVELSEKGRAALDKVAPQLVGQGDEVDVVGNTDDVPVGPALSDRYPTNWELGGARAALVVRHLQAAGVDPTAMRAVSAGQYHPVASNDTPQGRAKNRNTEILLRPR